MLFILLMSTSWLEIWLDSICQGNERQAISIRKEQVPYNQSISCKTKSAGLLLKNLWTYPSCLVASSSIERPKGLKHVENTWCIYCTIREKALHWNLRAYRAHHFHNQPPLAAQPHFQADSCPQHMLVFRVSHHIRRYVNQMILEMQSNDTNKIRLLQALSMSLTINIGILAAWRSIPG